MNGPTGVDDSLSALVRGAQAGDEAAFERLVRRLYGRIYRWALARTADGDDADDVTQQVLVKMHRQIGDFDGRSQFTTWLYQVARSAAADLHRRRARRERLARRLGREQDDAAQDLSAAGGLVEAGRAFDLVEAFLEELSDRQREVFDLCDLQGFGPGEVSAMLGLEPVTVRSHLFRARRTIRRKMLQRYPELAEGYGD